MQQHDFIWMAKKLGITNIIQDSVGNTTIVLRSNIHLIHSYKKKNMIQIVFTEDQSRYVISSKTELQKIISLHINNKNLQNILHKYCNDKLIKN